MNFYDIKVKTITGEIRKMEYYKNKVLLIVNVASKCGFTHQYEGLQALHVKYHSQGFCVLGFPCNQFLNQEPEKEEEIQQFCSLNFGVTFDLFAKVDVNGKNAHPLYKYLKNNGPKGLFTNSIKWNFTKFLLNRQGEIMGRFGPKHQPSELIESIESLL
jgi:glutathione peroxidase